MQETRYEGSNFASTPPEYLDTLPLDGFFITGYRPSNHRQRVFDSPWQPFALLFTRDEFEGKAKLHVRTWFSSKLWENRKMGHVI